MTNVPRLAIVNETKANQLSIKAGNKIKAVTLVSINLSKLQKNDVVLYLEIDNHIIVLDKLNPAKRHQPKHAIYWEHDELHLVFGRLKLNISRNNGINIHRDGKPYIRIEENLIALQSKKSLYLQSRKMPLQCESRFIQIVPGETNETKR